jgi:putative ABC transport system permease protein
MRRVLRMAIGGRSRHAVAMLFALSVGTSVSLFVFRAVWKVVLFPVPNAWESRLVAVAEVRQGLPADIQSVSPEAYDELREQRAAFERVGAVMAGSPVTALVRIGDSRYRVPVAFVDAGYLRLLGTKPVAGALFSETNDAPGGESVALLGAGFWRRRFGADASIVGRTIDVDGQLRRVLGVVADDSVYPRGVDVWMPDLPRASQEFFRRRLLSVYYGVAGLLRKGSKGPDPAKFRVFPLRDLVVADAGAKLWLLAGVCGCTLLIGLMNAAFLALVRARDRRAEIATERALGLTFGRYMAGAGAEGLVLGMIAGGLALAASLPLSTLVWASLPAEIGSALASSPVVEYALPGIAVAMAYGLLVTLSAAVVVWREAGDFPERFRSRASAAPRGGRIGFQVRIGVETALMFVAAAAGLGFAGRFLQLRRADLGFVLNDRVTGALEVPDGRYSTESERVLLFRRVLERVESSEPGSVAAITSMAPFGAAEPIPLSAGGVAGRTVTADAVYVGGEYFRAMGIPLLSGRGILASDVKGGPRVAVLSRVAARALGKSVGDTVVLSGFGGPAVEVVGICGDAGLAAVDGPVVPMIYLSYFQAPYAWHSLSLVQVTHRSAGEALARTGAVLSSIDPAMVISDGRSMRDLVDEQLKPIQFGASAMVISSATVLLLAAMGVFSVVALAVQGRQKEFAIRMAMGARPRDVHRLLGAAVSSAVLPGLAAGALGLYWVMSWFRAAGVPGAALAWGPAGLAAVAVCAAMIVPAGLAARSLDLDVQKTLRE